MRLGVGRSMAVFSMATALRSASGFVGHLRATSRHYPVVGERSRCRMSGSAAAAIDELKPRSVPVLDAQAAGLKAERLWGMADARKPESMARENTKAQPAAAKRSLFASYARGEREVGGFIEGEGETSALRRYQYTDRLVEDGEDWADGEEDDGNEYYI